MAVLLLLAAGLLGWLRVLPLGEAALPGWGGAMMVAGAVAMFYAVLVGLSQSKPKTVLAYSSVSKMGIMTIGVGLGLIAPDNWPLIASAILIYASHHGLAKGSLFLGVGMAAIPPASKGQRRLLIAGLLLPALSLSAAPLTSGMIAKNLLKVQAKSVASPWSGWVLILLPWSAVATSILMAHFLFLVWLEYGRAAQTQATLHDTPGSMWLSWSVLMLAVTLNPLFISLAEPRDTWTLKVMVSASWPVALGGGLAICVWLAARRQWISWLCTIPPGDLLVFVESRLSSLVASARSFGFEALPKWRMSFPGAWSQSRDRSGSWPTLDSVDSRFKRWSTGITLFLLLVMMFAVLSLLDSMAVQ